MHPVSLAQLPEELASRVRAATGEPAHLIIHQRSVEPDAGQQYLVEALTDDRITVMHVSLERDDSVSEATESLTLGDVLEVVVVETGAELVVQTSSGQHAVPVSTDMASTVQAARGDRDEPTPPKPRPRHGLT